MRAMEEWSTAAEDRIMKWRRVGCRNGRGLKPVRAHTRKDDAGEGITPQVYSNRTAEEWAVVGCPLLCLAGAAHAQIGRGGGWGGIMCRGAIKGK